MIGIKQIKYYANGTIETIDTRNVEGQKEFLIAKAKKECEDAMLEKVPVYKQLNVALGIIVGDEKDRIMSIIYSYRAACDEIESKVMSCKTLDELDNIK